MSYTHTSQLTILIDYYTSKWMNFSVNNDQIEYSEETNWWFLHEYKIYFLLISWSLTAFFLLSLCVSGSIWFCISIFIHSLIHTWSREKGVWLLDSRNLTHFISRAGWKIEKIGNRFTSRDVFVRHEYIQFKVRSKYIFFLWIS